MEVKEALDRYSELSPLYGFIHYRRRKVILKYLPDGISRLLQGKRGLGNALRPCTNSGKLHLARVAVHFQYIVEKFTPNDTTFAFTISSQLRDSALSKACSLHTASASIKSSCDSLRQRDLEEIAEDAQEAQSGLHDDDRGRAGSVDSIDSDRRQTLMPNNRAGDYLQERHYPAMRSPSPSQSLRTIRHHRDKALSSNTPEVRGNRLGFDDNQSEKGRSSFQSSRSPTRDPYSTYQYKPKIKLGPRPSIDSAKRTHKPDAKDGDPRPVSTLPPSIRLPGRTSASTTPRSPPKFSQEKPLPEVPVSPRLPTIPTQLLDPAGFTGVVTPAKAIEAKSQDMTPEKRKLMKAVQLRQKQLAARSVTKPLKPDSPSLEPLPRREDEIQVINEPSNPTQDRSILPDLEDSKEVSIVLRDVDDPTQAIVDSSPISILEPSEGPSTKASSMTDEDELQGREHSDSRMENEHLATKIEDLPPKSHDIRTPPAEVIDEDIISPFTQNHSVAIISTFAETMSPSEVPLPPISDDELQSLNYIEKPPGGERTPTDVFKPSETVDLLNPVRFHKPPLEEGGSSTIRTAGASSDQVQKGSSEGGMTPHIFKRTGEYPSLVIPKTLDHDSDLNVTRPSTGDTMNEPGFDRVPLKHGLPRSIRRISSHENSDDQFLSDDSFMEELGSATVQEAKPIQVSKSPINPLFPRQSGWEEVARKSRSVSNPADEGIKDHLRPLSPRIPLQSSFRSASASQPISYEPQQASTIMLKKVGVSSGISQRIKALEKLSSPGAPPASVILRKASLQKPLTVSEVVRSVPSFPQRMSSLPPVSSPEVTPVSPTAKPVNAKAASTSKKPRPESISVTATIIRDTRNLMPAVRVDPSEPRTLDLYESPLVVEHQATGTSTGSSPLKPPRHKFGDSRSASSSDTERQSETTQTARRDSFASRRSTRSRRGSEVDQTRSLSDTSSNGMSGPDGIRLDKKESRKSRLFKRMSTISSASRRSIVYAFNSPVKEAPIVEHHEAMYQGSPVTIDFGDVNVQFPDTLVSNLKLSPNLSANVEYSFGRGAISRLIIKGTSSYRHLRQLMLVQAINLQLL